MNSRHPGPRRVWKGGSEPRLLTPDYRDPVDPGDPGDPLTSYKSCIFCTPVGKNEQDVALALCFFDFFRTASCETYTFSTIFSRVTSKNALETYHSVGDVPEKVEKTSGDSLGGLRGSWQLSACRGQLRALLGGAGGAWEAPRKLSESQYIRKNSRSTAQRPLCLTPVNRPTNR